MQLDPRGPYALPGPASLSFSGGRTSGFMLRQVLDAHGGQLPDHVRVLFANTGREHPATLDFVAAIARDGRCRSHGWSTGTRPPASRLSAATAPAATASRSRP